MITFTPQQLTEAVQTAATLARNIAAFEAAKSPAFILNKAYLVVGAWEDIIACQNRLGFDFHQTAPRGNEPTAVRAALAVIKKETA